MKSPKEFEYYLKKGIIKKKSSNKPRARFLIEESEKSLKGLKKRVEVLGIDENNANSIVKDCYDIIMEKIRARLILDRFFSSGLFAHEAEISYLDKHEFSEKEIIFLNQLRYFRNSINYYGKILNEEYAEKVYNFLMHIINKLRKISKI